MKWEPIVFLSLLGAVGYVVFHGHRLGEKDCLLCKYRGLTFAVSCIALGIFLALTE